MAMSYFGETSNFIWNTQTDCLGEGSFGKVFRGVNKQTGDRVAVKTFKHPNQEVMKEMNMLYTLRHKYVVQLLAVEMEENTHDTVLVMELCNGGSLMQFLNEPENMNGLVDEEFLLVVEHLTEGLKYLKIHNVIHRDVKPDNIMRHVRDDGQVIYKLADFGTARRLPEGENFTSIHGTEPYLHPHLYKVSFFRDIDFNREFNCNTDLWSIGVTMYHIATGFLPFRVEDRRAMLTIFNEMTRRRGVISAVQELYSERVIFQKSLPQTSRLSVGLKGLITPIIAGLFIHDDLSEQWSFDKYYEEIKEVVKRRVIRVFHINAMQVLTVYVRLGDTFEDFQNYVYEQSGIIHKHQGFFYNKKLIVYSIEDFPFGITDFLYFFDKSTHEISPVIMATCPDLSNFRENFLMNCTHDVPYAHRTSKDLGACKQLIEDQSLVYFCFNNFVKDFVDFFKEDVKEQCKLYDYLLEKCASINDKVKIFNKIEEMLPRTDDRSFSEKFELITRDFVPQASKLFDSLNQAENDIHVVDICYDYYLKTITKELLDMKQLYRSLIKISSYTKNYSVEKIKITHCVDTVWNILGDKVKPQFDDFFDQVKEWYHDIFIEHFVSLKMLKKHLHAHRCNLKKFEGDVQAQIEKKLDLVIKKQCQQKKLQNFLNELREYKLKNGDVNLLIEENSELISTMNLISFDITEEVD